MSNAWFEPLARPESVDPERLPGSTLTTLMAAGIVNPFGPTLAGLALEGETRWESRLPLLHVSLNPFRKAVRRLGMVDIEQSGDLVADLEIFSTLALDGCPTLLLPSRLFEHGDAVRLYARFLTEFSDSGDTFDGIRRHPGDPWTRVQGEIDGGLSSLLEKFTNAELDLDREPQPISLDAAREFASTQLDPTNLREELKAFLYAWKGSVGFQAGGGDDVKEAAAHEGLNHLMPLLRTCRIPDLSS